MLSLSQARCGLTSDDKIKEVNRRSTLAQGFVMSARQTENWQRLGTHASSVQAPNAHANWIECLIIHKTGESKVQPTIAIHLRALKSRTSE